MKVTYIAYLHSYTSMGVIAINVIKELTKLGYDIGFHVLNLDEININDYPQEVQIAIKKGFHYDSVGIFFSYPDIYPQVRCKINTGYTGADSTGWYLTQNQISPAEICNDYMDYLLTPSDFSKKNMEECGVTIPIFVFPHGIDVNLLKPKLRIKKNKFVLSYCGELTNRKGSQDLIESFIELVGHDKNYELHLRANTHMYYYGGQEIDDLCKDYSNIKLVWKNEGQSDISQYYTNSDLYVYPSRADWFGMTPFESLATGLPTIATSTNGYYEFIKDYIQPLAYTQESINNQHPYLKGDWFRVSKENIKQAILNHLNNCDYENDKAFYQAAKYIHENFTWKDVTKNYLVPFLEMVRDKHFKDERMSNNMDVVQKEKVKRVTVGIPTKDRELELGLLLLSLLNQTYKDFDVLIVDDCSSDLLYSNTTLSGLMRVLKENNHNVTILKGQQRGPHIGGQMILDNANTELILRLDDDVALFPDFIEKLVLLFNDKTVGAAGPIYLNPHKDLSEQIIEEKISENEELFERCGKVFWEGQELFLTGYLQNVIHKNTAPFITEHLNSGFMYRREAGQKIGGYCLELSPVGHREESDFSYRIFREGYKLLVHPLAKAYHYHPMKGGIRETQGVYLSKDNWDHDESIFLERMKKILPMDKELVETISTSVIVLTHDDNHELAKESLDRLYKYTTFPCEIILVNNGIKSCEEFSDRYSNKHISLKIIITEKDLPVGSARNLGVEYSTGKYICFLDDDSLILGRYNQTTDWLGYLYNEFHLVNDTGAFGPVYTWCKDVQSYVLSTACLFTSKKVWEIVGGFDSVFGNKKKNTFGYEDTDWCYRVSSAGFKIRGIEHDNFPFFHDDTTSKSKTIEREKALENGRNLFLQKYDFNEINYLPRKQYPFFDHQMDIKGIKLNIGCYYMYIDGFVNIDIQNNVGADLVCDLRNIKQCFSDNTVSLILISQCLEHVNLDDAKKALKDFYDILLPEGTLIVEVPLLDNIDNPNLSENDKYVLLHGTPTSPFQEHLSGFKSNELEEILMKIGFKNITRISQEYTSDQWESLRIDCTK